MSDKPRPHIQGEWEPRGPHVVLFCDAYDPPAGWTEYRGRFTGHAHPLMMAYDPKAVEILDVGHEDGEPPAGWKLIASDPSGFTRYFWRAKQ